MSDDKWIHHSSHAYAHQQPPPRLSLREYGGPLTPINEIPQLQQQSSSLIYTKHRLSSSLTLPATCTILQRETKNDDDVSRRRHTLPSSTNNETAMNLLVDFPHNDTSRRRRRSLLLVDFPHDDNEDEEEDDDSTAATNNGCDTNEKYETNNNNNNNATTTTTTTTTTAACCDEYGRCIKHPHVQLRSKILFWDRILLTACPDCCMDELTRLYENYSTGKNDDEDDDDDSTSSISTTQESIDYYD